MPGTISFFEKILLKLPIPDIVREKILQIPFLITHDVLNIFVGHGVERIVVTPESLQFAYGVDLLVDSKRVKTRFSAFHPDENQDEDG